MLRALKKLFVKDKDYAGRNIEDMLTTLQNRYGGDWSYIKEDKAYENVLNGQRIYPHEIRV